MESHEKMKKIILNSMDESLNLFNAILSLVVSVEGCELDDEQRDAVKEAKEVIDRILE